MSDLQANSVYWWEVAEEAKAEIERLRAELAARDNAAVDAIAQAYEDGRISACNAGKPGCPRVVALEAECARLRDALRILDGFVEPAPTASQWSAVCAKARELKAELAKEPKS